METQTHNNITVTTKKRGFPASFNASKRVIARSILKRRYTTVTWQANQPHPEWQRSH